MKVQIKFAESKRSLQVVINDDVELDDPYQVLSNVYAALNELLPNDNINELSFNVFDQRGLNWLAGNNQQRILSKVLDFVFNDRPYLNDDYLNIMKADDNEWSLYGFINCNKYQDYTMELLKQEIKELIDLIVN